MEYQKKHSTPERLFRAAILNGITPPPAVVETLEARGVNTSALEQRLRQQMEWRH
jgi:hypothetical protein